MNLKIMNNQEPITNLAIKAITARIEGLQTEINKLIDARAELQCAKNKQDSESLRTAGSRFLDNIGIWSRFDEYSTTDNGTIRTLLFSTNCPIDMIKERFSEYFRELDDQAYGTGFFVTNENGFIGKILIKPIADTGWYTIELIDYYLHLYPND